MELCTVVWMTTTAAQQAMTARAMHYSLPYITKKKCVNLSVYILTTVH
jgi:hypothetical protein